jgi:hypothetical protein
MSSRKLRTPRNLEGLAKTTTALSARADTHHPPGEEVLAFASAATQIAPRVLPHGGWLTDARLCSLGFSRWDIRAIRRGEPIGRVLARQEARRTAKARSPSGDMGRTGGEAGA